MGKRRDNQMLFYYARQVRVYQLLRELRDIIECVIRPVDNAFADELQELEMELDKAIPISPAAQDEARETYTGREERSKQRRMERREHLKRHLAKYEEKMKESERYHYRRWIEREIEEVMNRPNASILLRLAAWLAQQALASDEQQDDDGNDLDPDVWGTLFTGDD